MGDLGGIGSRIGNPNYRAAPQLGGPNWGVPREGTFAGLEALRLAMRGGPRLARLNRPTGPLGSEPAPAWPVMASQTIIWRLFANMAKSVSACSVVAVLSGKFISTIMTVYICTSYA